MPYRVVTIARSLGAGGEEVGRLTAGALGFRHIDDEVIVTAARRAGVSPEVIERAEQRRPLVMRILDAMAASGGAEAMAWQPETFIPAARTESYQDFITEVIGEVADEGNVVLVAHGAGVRLAGRADVLRVFVTASPDVRAGRVAQATAVDERKAMDLVRESDRSRGDFLRRFYGVREEQPTHYDLVVNTGAVPPELAADLIVAAARAPGAGVPAG